MEGFETLAETVGTAVLRHERDGTITYATPATEGVTGYSPAELKGKSVGELLSGKTGDEMLARLQSEQQRSAVFRAETTVVTKSGAAEPVELRANAFPGSDEGVVSIRTLRKRKRREQYLQFARDVNELIIRAEDESSLLQEIIAAVTDREFGCTSVALLDDRGEVADIYGVMEDWCQMDWESVYTGEYVAEVFERGDLVIEDVTQGPHRQHTVEEADHGAIALTLAHRGTRYGILTMHLPGKGSSLSPEERDLLRELADNVSTGLYNLRTETRLRESRKQLAVLDRVLRHNLRNALNVVIGNAEAVAETSSGDQQHHARLIRDRASALLETADKEREIVELIVEQPPVTEVDLVATVERCVEKCRREHPDAEITTNLPETAPGAAIQEITRAIEELLENAVVHSDREVPDVTVDVRRTGEQVVLEIADDGPGIPEQETSVLTTGRDIDPLGHGSGLALWLVNWIVEFSDGDVQFRERDPRGSVVTITLRSAVPVTT